MIYLLIDVLSSLIKVKMSIGWHRCLDGLGLLHVKLLQHVIGVLGLTYERAILKVLDDRAGVPDPSVSGG